MLQKRFFNCLCKTRLPHIPFGPLHSKIIAIAPHNRQIQQLKRLQSVRFTSSDISSQSQTSTNTQKDIQPTKTKFESPLMDFNKTKVQNQQFSDHNNLPLFVAITPNAAAKLNEIASEDSNENLALRVQVESGGCHGFQYHLELSDIKEFKPDQEDSMFVRDGAKVLMDKTTLEILRDSKIDYVHELIGSQFKVVDSPYTKSSCGCGSSFDFDFDKLDHQT